MSRLFFGGAGKPAVAREVSATNGNGLIRLAGGNVGRLQKPVLERSQLRRKQEQHDGIVDELRMLSPASYIPSPFRLILRASNGSLCLIFSPIRLVRHPTLPDRRLFESASFRPKTKYDRTRLRLVICAE